MKAVGYIRVSTREQADTGISLEMQEEKIREYCAYKELELVSVISDEGVSASIPLEDRVGGKSLLESLGDDCKCVVALKLDRLFRDAHDCLGVTKDWDKREISLHLLNMGIDTRTAMGRAFLSNAATYAELERNLISERTKEALSSLKDKGVQLGALKMGWKYTGEKDSDGRKVLVRDDDELKTIILCKELRASGLTLQQIARKLNRDGIKTKRGGSWYPTTVRNYCNKPV